MRSWNHLRTPARALVGLRAALFLALIASPARAEEPEALDARAERVAALRAEVAALQDQLQEQREDTAVRLRALDAQQVDLEVQVRREELRLDQLGEALTRQRQSQVDDAGLEAQVKPVVLASLAEVRAQVAAGLPFRVEERLAALDELRVGVEGGELPPTKALGRLWAFVEDEQRLSRENALDRQTIPLDGGEVLAEVARLGMVGMYWRAPDGRVGLVTGADAGWAFEPVTDRAGIVAIETLFDALRKGIRTGFYELPWAFGGVR